MSKRRVIIGPGQSGPLWAFNTILNLPPILEKNPNIDFESLFYSSMIQSGVEQFEVILVQCYPIRKSEFLDKRISFIPKKIYLKQCEIVDKAFENYLPEDDETDEKYLPVWQLKSFLSDLFLSIRRKVSMVCFTPIPDLTKVEKLIPAELFYPIQHLIAAFDCENVKLPLPQKTIKTSDVKRFQDIISSDLFSQYTSAHGELEDSKLTKKKAILNITKVGQALFQKNRALLYLKDLTISLLPITPKVIDTVFGKLPGILAEYSGKILNNLLKDERRIVLYLFFPMFENILFQRLSNLRQPSHSIH